MPRVSRPAARLGPRANFVSRARLSARRVGTAIRLALIASAFAATTPLGTLSAQRLGPAPKRPKIASADTNDARAYYDLGMRVIASDPGNAASAFYWAARIDPGMADALHGRRAALMLEDEFLLKRSLEAKSPSKKQLQLDSLQLRAIMINPLLYRKLDLSLLQTYYRQLIEREYPGSSRPSQLEIDHAIDQMLRQGGPSMRGWMAYARGDFKDALSAYADAMKSTKEKAGFRIERARIFGMRGDADSAIAEFQLALTELKKKDAKDLVVLYNSKAVIEHAIGLMLQQKDDWVGARAAYERALQEDLAYWPAHLSLGIAAVTGKDTATALSEYSLAADIAPDEPYVHAMAGGTLALLGRSREAIPSLKKASVLEPYYALPHVLLAKVYESTNATADATASYEAFLARASANDAQRDFAVQRLAALKAKP